MGAYVCVYVYVFVLILGHKYAHTCAFQIRAQLNCIRNYTCLESAWQTEIGLWL